MKETHPRYAIGVDLGTTNISATVLDLGTGALAQAVTEETDAALPRGNGAEREQDAEAIIAKAKELLDSLLEEYGSGSFAAIGLTGQMHGIVTLSGNGALLSRLATWQDGRAGEGVPSPSERIASLTGYSAPPGYGLATYYADMLAGRIAERMAKVATIADYFGMRLTGRSAPLMHTSNAASLGLFDIPNMRFDTEAIGKLGIPLSILPEVMCGIDLLGAYRGIPVTAAIGDNQAAFFGSVSSPDTSVLANFGTGSQISLAADASTIKIGKKCGSVEIRPLTENRILLSGSALCGGRAWAMFERFFRSYLAAAGFDAGEQYAAMDRLAALALEKGCVLPVSTTFSGTRDDPTARGEITGIGEDNFTPGALLAGVLSGMVRELYAMYETMPREKIKTLVLSGNAARMNPTLMKIAEQIFGLEVVVPVCREEAALGAALKALDAVGFDSERKGDFIRYSRVGK